MASQCIRLKGQRKHAQSWGRTAGAETVLCQADDLGVAPDGYVSAGWLPFVFGLPLTAIEALFEELDLSFVPKMANLFILALLDWLAIGALAGDLVKRRKMR